MNVIRDEDVVGGSSTKTSAEDSSAAQLGQSHQPGDSTVKVGEGQIPSKERSNVDVIEISSSDDDDDIIEVVSCNITRDEALRRREREELLRRRAFLKRKLRMMKNTGE
jgi:hypothetical protein